jgi:hypothetical protein
MVTADPAIEVTERELCSGFVVKSKTRKSRLVGNGFAIVRS